jgi:hypothetical protein
MGAKLCTVEMCFNAGAALSRLGYDLDCISLLRSADVCKNMPEPKNVMRFKSTLINVVSPIADQQNSACRQAMVQHGKGHGTKD